MNLKETMQALIDSLNKELGERVCDRKCNIPLKFIPCGECNACKATLAIESAEEILNGNSPIGHFYVSNGGDGSANTRFYESEKVAELLDESQNEGWGEPSTGVLKLESFESIQQSYVKCCMGEFDYEDLDKKELIQLMGGLPHFQVRRSQRTNFQSGDRIYRYYDILIDNEIVHNFFSTEENFDAVINGTLMTLGVIL